MIIGLCITIAIIISGCGFDEEYPGAANCYAYALDIKQDPRTGEDFITNPNPGEFSGSPLSNNDYSLSSGEFKKLIITKVESDANVLGLTFSEVSSATHTVTPGNWLVALAYSPDHKDYHWWRRNDDGTWSHKQGRLPISAWDASNSLIYDPATCDRGIYTEFIGYFEVGPT